MKAKITYWRESDGKYLGYFNDYPDHWTQGENLDEFISATFSNSSVTKISRESAKRKYSKSRENDGISCRPRPIRPAEDCILYLVPNPRQSPAMDTFESDVEICADGSMRLLSPRPAWLKPGRARVLMTVEPHTGQEKPNRQKLTATPEMIERRMAALEEIRRLNPYRNVIDPVKWQREIRKDRPIPSV